jgi:hypothetical protein
VGEKTPVPLGPLWTAVAALGELVTAADAAAVPVDRSLVVVADGALVDELVPEVLVDDTASCAGAGDCKSINKSRAATTTNMRCSVNFIFSVFFISRPTKAQTPRAQAIFLAYTTPAKADRDFWQTSMSGAA